jgi:hypothetical protein
VSDKPASTGGPVGDKTPYVYSDNVANEKISGLTSDHVAVIPLSPFAASRGRGWYACKFCGKPEDGPHEENCPGDTVAMLLRIQDLEREVQRLKAMMEAGK